MGQVGKAATAAGAVPLSAVLMSERAPVSCTPKHRADRILEVAIGRAREGVECSAAGLREAEAIHRTMGTSDPADRLARELSP